MNLEDYLLKKLKAGDSVFRYIPDNIGDIVYCDSSNPKDGPDSKKTTQRKVILSVVIPCCIAILSWIFISDAVVVNLFISVSMIAIMLICIYMSMHFRGTDYFVGTEGAAEISFDKSRDNTTVKRNFRFEDFGDLITKETVSYNDTEYDHTSYEFTIYGKESGGKRALIAQFYGNYTQNDSFEYYKDQKFRFWKTIEKQWGKYKIDSLKASFDKGEPVGFSFYLGDNFCNDFFVFQGSQLSVGNVTFDKTNVKNIVLGKEALIIEHVNHSSKLFGLITKGDKATIPLEGIGNKELFLTFFKYFESTL